MIDFFFAGFGRRKKIVGVLKIHRKLTNFEYKIDHNSKNKNRKNRKIDFSFVAHCASFMKIGLFLISEGRGGTYPYLGQSQSLVFSHGDTKLFFFRNKITLSRISAYCRQIPSCKSSTCFPVFPSRNLRINERPSDRATSFLLPGFARKFSYARIYPGSFLMLGFSSLLHEREKSFGIHTYLFLSVINSKVC